MFRRYFKGLDRLTYINRLERVTGIALLVFFFVVLPCSIVGLVLLLRAPFKDYVSTGYAPAEVLNATISENKFSSKLYMTVRTASDRDFQVISVKRKLFALAGETVCIEVFENTGNKDPRADLVGRDNCTGVADE